ncbi:hypothetical protein K2Z83_13935 [Oscillochloris sp. ZM17-4]|uniref:hypothetical protein n=1 Tax=Oscillochloris sp. ZM17-4 TaxID=2866714 RepID=UPI001C72E240|nr:hypothetical protein [Oscillochloris sp. ZM17-4]MBX0328774.1 hypothetical protein [Oscillochloris sp. ZM17-4]
MSHNAATEPTLTTPPGPISHRTWAAIYNALPLWALLLTIALTNYPQLSRDLWTDEAYGRTRRPRRSTS